MKNIFKFLRDKTAKIIACGNVITVEREDGQIAVFEGNKDNYCIEYNTGNLGGGIFRDRNCGDYLEIEPLKLECQHFISCCEEGKKARSDGQNGYDVVSILEEAERIMLGERAKQLDNVDFALSRTKGK